MTTYYLTDGFEIFEEKIMTPYQYIEAQKIADEASEGNIWWTQTPKVFEPFVED